MQRKNVFQFWNLEEGHVMKKHTCIRYFFINWVGMLKIWAWKILSYCANNPWELECIPVGCVPAARRPYAWVCFPGGCLPGPGGCLPGPGVCSGGVCLVWGGVCLVWGVSAWSGGVSAWSGGCIPACTEADTLPPSVDRILDTRLWKYYLGPTSLRPVTRDTWDAFVGRTCRLLLSISLYGRFHIVFNRLSQRLYFDILFTTAIYYSTVNMGRWYVESYLEKFIQLPWIKLNCWAAENRKVGK